MVKAVVFDLDDTLYMENEFVWYGLKNAANVAETVYGIVNANEKIRLLYQESKVNVFDRLVNAEKIKDKEIAVAGLVKAYRNCEPKSLHCNPGVLDLLKTLKKKEMHMGIITDGFADVQKSKIKALGIQEYIDKIVITDELGGVQCRKPNPIGFEKMLKMLDVKPQEMVYIGDNPNKDFAIKKYLPIITARVDVPNGIYRNSEYLYGIKPDIIVKQIGDILQDERLFG